MRHRQHRKLQATKSREFSRKLKVRLLRKERFSKMIAAVAEMPVARIDIPDAVEIDSGSSPITFTIPFPEKHTDLSVT